MFSRIFEVQFNVSGVSDTIDDEDDDVSDDDSCLIEATICCPDDLSLSAFAAQLEQHKIRVVSDLGFCNPDDEVTIVSITDVSEESYITVFPPKHLQH